MRDPTGKANFVVLPAGIRAATALGIARTLCREGATCRVLGWIERAAVPTAFPITPAARAALAFSYTRDPAGAEIVLFACERVADAPPGQCIPRPR